MGINIEIKAKAHEPDRLRQVLASLCESTCEVVFQEDVFFHTPKGRLKLRILARDRGELIYYERDNIAAPKQSNYLRRSDFPENLAFQHAGSARGRKKAATSLQDRQYARSSGRC
jgi:hypothetical protein